MQFNLNQSQGYEKLQETVTRLATTNPWVYATWQRTRRDPESSLHHAATLIERLVEQNEYLMKEVTRIQLVTVQAFTEKK